MQLQQAELQDTGAQMHEDTQSLKNKLRESEVCLLLPQTLTHTEDSDLDQLQFKYLFPSQKKAFVSAVELEELRSSLFKVQLELRMATEKHQQQ